MIRHNKKSLIRSALPIMLVAQVYPAVAADISVIEPAPVVSEEAVAAAFDVAFGVGLTSDYISRGIANFGSNRRFSHMSKASFEATD